MNPTPPRPEPPPRCHARQQLGSDALYPGMVTARLAVMSLAQWQRVEAFLFEEGFKPY
ncbi:MAG: hypothetical protein ACRYFV_15865 [Janthinobacterium lividum]